MKVFDKNGKEIMIQEIEKTGIIQVNNALYYQVINGVCYVYISSSNYIELKPNEYITIGTIPYHPEIEVNFQIHFIGDQKFIGSSCYVDTEGNVKIFVTELTGYFAGSVSFPIAST